MSEKRRPTRTEYKRSRASLRGLEGRGARLFFEALARSLPQEWGFAKRHKRPPTDPINSMLSYGYHLLFQHATTSLIAAGLNPHVGFLHAPSSRYPALAYDLIEEMRFLVDALTWRLVRQRQVKVADFEERGRAVWMTADFRRRFTDAFERRLLDSFTPRGGAPTTYRAFLAQQAVHLRELALGRLTLYKPLRLRA